MSDKTTVLKMRGKGLTAFRHIFDAYVNTGSEASAQDSDFCGSIDADGRFYISRKGRGRDAMNYDARLTGTVSFGTSDEKSGTETTLEYSASMSRVFLTCLVAIGILCAGFLTYALIAFFRDGITGPLLPASFFTIAFLIMLVIALFRPDCRALEKCIDKIAGEYAQEVD